jgi:hypothetical protein
MLYLYYSGRVCTKFQLQICFQFGFLDLYVFLQSQISNFLTKAAFKNQALAFCEKYGYLQINQKYCFHFLKQH